MGAWWSTDEDSKDREIRALRRMNELQRLDIARLRAAVMDKPGVEKKHTPISRDWVLAWVDEQLERPGSNIGWIPDAIERQLKTDIFVMFLDFIDHLFESTRIETMNHRVRIDIEALPDKKHD